ncbi:MAG TPA: hypothetical protein VIG33_02710 [Pseudobdellovibrionaceae bacterium]|jgi:hypothetical protein
MRSIIFLVGAVLSVSMAFASGTTVGNGGDEIRFTFEDARIEAIRIINNIKECSFDSTTSADVRSWILNNSMALASDIQNSAHQWTNEDRPTCAWTQLSARSEIVLSYPSCALNMSTQKAAQLLIHESVHHFGINNESFADAVAVALNQATPGVICSKSTLPENTKWKVRDRLRQMLPPNSKTDSIYFGSYKDTGSYCTVLLSTGEVTDPNKVKIDSFTISVLEGRFNGSGVGISISVLANTEGSPYLPGYVTFYKDDGDLLSMDYITKYLNQKWEASSLTVNSINSSITEVTIANKNAPRNPIIKTCILEN